MAGALSVFGKAVHLDAAGLPDWNADPVTGQRVPLQFGLFIDFRHVGDGIDIKHLWEVNRHAWCLPLAQAWALTGNRAYLQRLGELVDSWLEACPYPQGANWSSPVEHGVRLINWSLIWHLIGGERSALFADEAGQLLRRRWLDSVYRHMRFASDNYSFYSSADNHLIGEAAGVFVASHTWDHWAESRVMRARAKEILESETIKQFSADGVNLEQALCYHKFSLQFLLAAALAGDANGDRFGQSVWARLESAVVFLAAMTDVNGHLPRYGDADDGDVWSFGGEGAHEGYWAMLLLGSALFPRADLMAKADALRRAGANAPSWLRLPERAPAATKMHGDVLPAIFPAGGYALLGLDLHKPAELRVLVDCGALGYNRIAGHGHADALSVLLSCDGQPLLVDSGTYCYNAAPEWRRYFRGTSAHNTLVVDGQDQAVYGASFLWLTDVNTTIATVDGSGGGTIHAHHDGYMRLPDPVRHHRRVRVNADRSVLVEDWLECADEHLVALHWHGAKDTILQPSSRRGDWQLVGPSHMVTLGLSGPSFDAEPVAGQETPVQGWVSPAFYVKEPAPVLQVRARMRGGDVLRTLITVAPRQGNGAESMP